MEHPFPCPQERMLSHRQIPGPGLVLTQHLYVKKTKSAAHLRHKDHRPAMHYARSCRKRHSREDYVADTPCLQYQFQWLELSPMGRNEGKWKCLERNYSFARTRTIGLPRLCFRVDRRLPDYP